MANEQAAMPDEIKNIFYKQELRSFLEGFVTTEDNIQNGLAPETAPTSTEQVLNDIKDIWDNSETPVLHPAELRSALLEKYMPDADPKMLEIVNQVERSRYQPETMTGYLEKQHLGILSSLGHLYAQSTGQSISMVEVDYSNMGGTNEHFRAQMAEEQGVDAQDLPVEQAFHLTDLSACLIAKTIQSEMEDVLNDGQTILPIRAGGDELRLIVTGLNKDDYHDVMKTIHEKIEDHMANLNLHDHVHLKDKTNPYKNGFGAAISIVDMRGINPATVVHDADEEIKAQKAILGRIRHGEIDQDGTQKVFEAYFQDHPERVPDGKDITTHARDMTDQALEQAKQRQQQFQEMKSATPGSIAAKVQYMEDSIKALAIDEMSKTGGTSAKLSDVPKEDLQNFATPAEKRLASMMSAIQSQGVTIKNSYEESYLKHVALSTTPVDSSSNTWMPNDLPEMLETYIEDSQRLSGPPQSIFSAGNDGDGPPKPMIMGVSFHNLGGLNDAIGHDGANLALQYMSENVIGNALEQAGIDKDDYQIAHYGGAEFQIITKPSDNITQDTMNSVQKKIEDKVNVMAKLNIVDFLDNTGLPPSDNQRAKIEGMTFDDIPDIKPDRGIRGVHSVVTHRPAELRDASMRTGHILHEARQDLEQKTEQHRAGIIAQRTTSRYSTGQQTPEAKHHNTQEGNRRKPQANGRKR